MILFQQRFLKLKKKKNNYQYRQMYLVVKTKFLVRCTVSPNKPKCQSLEQRKMYCKGQARRMGGSCSKDPNSLMAFREEFSWAKFGVKAVGCVIFFWLVGGEATGWCSRNLVFSLKLPSSTRVGALVLVELKNILLCVSLEGEPGPCPIATLLFLDCLSFVSAFPHSSN